MKTSISRISLSHKWYEVESEATPMLSQEQRKALAVICYYIYSQK